MALTVFSSNRIESLQDRLANSLLASPLADPFTSEIIIVPTYAMGRWLNLRFAQQQGIAANILYPQPAQWIWQLAANQLPGLPHSDPYAGDTLCWQCFNRLPGLLSHKAFAELRRYLGDDDSGIRRWQLAQRIAASFDGYQAYRPQMIREWDAGGEDHWQARLWRALVEDTRLPHRSETLAQLIEHLVGDDLAPLPERINLFALSSLAPLYLEVLRGLARHVEMNLYLHSPTDQYWADLENEKRKARLRLDNPGEDEWFDSSNELLASWGRQGQLFQDLMLSTDDFSGIDIELFTEPVDESLLGKIQQSMFTLNPQAQAARADGSVTLHICHSAMRECQVLLDQLLDMLEQDSELNPEDILVMIPDIGSYAPYIEAVFRNQKLSYNLSDITLADEHPLVTCFLQLLRLPRSRFTVSEISAMLDNLALRRRFEIDDASLDEVQRLLSTANIRWGIDGAHKQQLDLPATEGNTWQQARERFFAGIALFEDKLWNGISPLAEWSDSEADAVGRFWHFFDHLCIWRRRLDETRTAAEWQTLLNQMLDEFFVETDAVESRLQQIRDAISSLQQSPSTDLTPELIEYLLQNQLRSQEHHGQLYSGGVTFCGMRPMRSIPFKVICLLGMNHGDFPRRDPHSDFELMSRTPRAGDPSKAVEDRYLMLETLLCARHRLYISYTGRSLRDNSPIQPSVLVQELLDFIDSQFHCESMGSGLAAELVEVHPMQAFAAENFIAPKVSYQQHWGEIARHLTSPRESRISTWPDQALQNSMPDNAVKLAHLKRFIRHPVRYFFQQRLGVYLGEDSPLENDETFELDPLQKWRIKQQLGADILAQRDDSEARIRAEGRLGHGQAARAQLDEIRQDQVEWLDRLQAFAGLETETRPVELRLSSGICVDGILADFFPERGLMAYQAGRFKGQHLLELWIDHLALSACDGWKAGQSSQLLSADQNWTIKPVANDTAMALLDDYCKLYRDGMCRPLPIFPEASYAWAGATDPDQAYSLAAKAWQNQRVGSDATDPYLQLALREAHQAPIGSEAFATCANQLYATLLMHGEKQ